MHGVSECLPLTAALILNTNRTNDGDLRRPNHRYFNAICAYTNRYAFLIPSTNRVFRSNRRSFGYRFRFQSLELNRSSGDFETVARRVCPIPDRQIGFLFATRKFLMFQALELWPQTRPIPYAFVGAHTRPDRLRVTIDDYRSPDLDGSCRNGRRILARYPPRRGLTVSRRRRRRRLTGAHTCLIRACES